MPHVIYEKVMTLAEPLPAGGRIQSALFDVNGAQAVHLTLRLAGGDPDVFWSVHFGPTQNNAFGQTAMSTFDADGLMAAPFPVFGPKMMVVVENRGTLDNKCDGNLYFIREVP